MLLLPLAEWIDARGARAWLAIAPLAAAGFLVQVITAATNFGFIANSEGYPDFRPQFGFLFVPASAPIAAEARAIFAGDGRVDFWLLNVWRSFGPVRVAEIAIPLALLFALCMWRLGRALHAFRREAAQ